MENNNGRGIFYGVIGVATLVVAIIGATFAYFTASANSNDDAVTVGGGTVSLSWAEVPTGLKDNLIPLDPSQSGFSKIIGTSTTSCQDKNDNNVCSVYQFSVGNPAGQPAQTIYASLRPKTNGFTTGNLKFAIFFGDAASVAAKASVNVEGEEVAVATATAGDLVVSATPIAGTTKIDLTELNEVLNAGVTRTYTVVMWIDETDGEQNADQGKSFTGGIFFTTVGGDSNTGITGILTA